MRAIMVMYDSLNRRFLSSYGCKESITPNFQRLSDHTVTFDNCYAGSLPCIPVRRELQTGRYNFLHRNWGPMEPYDDSMPQMLAERGVYTHLVTDHCHYWQEGGVTYHTRYSSAEFIRGQEGDFWKGRVNGFTHNLDLHRQDGINRAVMQEETEHPHVKTFEAGMEFLEANVGADNWFLQLEYFDPHEPYFLPKHYKEMVGAVEGDFDWPFYDQTDDPVLIQEARRNYLGVLAMCDHYLGKILDFMDDHDMWKDTMLIVNTDHGFMLGEHGCFAKNYMPCYDEIVHLPLFLWDPRLGKKSVRTSKLVQTIDIPCTILDFFGVPASPRMQGCSLYPVIAYGETVREYALFGLFGKHINITDGRYVYMRSARDNRKLNNYGLLPLNIFTPYSLEELKQATMAPAEMFSFTQGVPLIKTPASDEMSPQNSAYQYSLHMQYGDLLFDLEKDCLQKEPLRNEEVELRMTDAMRRMMVASEAPPEQFQRIGLE